MKSLSLSQLEARKISLYSQGLTEFRWGAGEAGIRMALEELGYVQIDTISVVARAHHHVLWTRVEDYHPDQLHRLLSAGEVFEYWSHATSYLPMRDFRFSLPRKRLYALGKRHWFKETADHKRWRRRILARIRAEGPLPARAFEAPEGQGPSGWFNWKPAKQALEQLFMEGKLMVAGRQGFQKLYDLSERVIPSGTDTAFPSEKEQARHLILTSLKAHGFLRPEEMAYLRSGDVKARVKAECTRMEKSGELLRLSVEGINKPYLASAQEFPLLASSALAAPAGPVKILSPFDNQVIQRKRLRELFGFDYFIECYVPEPKRKFGYYCLPILDGDRFTGRLDAKAHREERRFELRSLHWENKGSWKKLRAQVETYARFTGCDTVARAD